MNYELTGKIIAIGNIQEFKNNFTKRDLIVEVPGEYPQKIKFEVVKDNCKKLDNFSTGHSINVTFDLRGNEYEGKYYTNLVACKFEKIEIEAQDVSITIDGEESDLLL